MKLIVDAFFKRALFETIGCKKQKDQFQTIILLLKTGCLYLFFFLVGF